jgi:Dolichyl-phosphate-mannose-protein mannosyltransferase
VSVAPAIRPRLASRWQTFEAWVGTPTSAAALFVLALAVFALQSAVLPVHPGRDMDRYLQAFVQLGYAEPVYPYVIDSRGPLAALGVGVPLSVGGAAAEIWLGLLYAFSIVAWGIVALTFGARAAVLTSGLLLVYPGYGILFHELASDSLFAAGFAGWALLLSKAILRPSIRAFLVTGIAMGLLVLVRPANQVLIVFALFPLLLRAPWGRRLAWASAFFVASAVVTQGWKALEHLRYGDVVALRPSSAVLVTALVLLPFLFPSPWRRRLAVLAALLVVGVVVVKGSNVRSPVGYARAAVQLPSGDVFLFRAFELDRIMTPDNGPASREMGRVVQRELLTKEPYRSYGVDLHQFFSSGSDRVFGDLTSLAGSIDLPAATQEAIRRHPGTFATSIARTIWEQLWKRRVYAPTGTANANEESSQKRADDVIVVNGRRLPRPSEGQPIPASRVGPVIRTLGGPAREVWRSPTEHYFVFTDPRDKRRYEKFQRDAGRLGDRIPTRDGNGGLIHRLNQSSHAFPPPVAWLGVGLVALAVRRPQRALVALGPSIAGLLVIFSTSLVAPSVAQYAAPVSPAFLLLAAAGLLGAHPRGHLRLARRRATAS